MTSSDQWQNNWRAVAAPGAVRIDLRDGAAADRHASGSRLESGDDVVIGASAPGAARRSRRFAAESGVHIDRVYLAFPSAAAPAYLVEDSAAAIAAFSRSVLVAPPRARFALPIEAALLVVRRLRLWWLVRMLAPGRLAVGRKL